MVKLATWLTRALPLGMQLWLADAIAGTGHRLLPAMHGRVRDNVRHILGPSASPQQVEGVARKQWHNYLRYMRDFAALPHSASAETERIFATAEGWQHIEEALSHGRGLVLVSAHFGNWDLAAGAMARVHPVNVIADTFSSSKLDSAINQRRLALGLKVIPIEKAVRRIASALRRNEAVAFLIDKPLAGDDGLELELCGSPVRLPAGAAYFASRLNAPLVVAFVWRNPDQTFSSKIFPPVQADKDPRITMQRILAMVESMIRQHPEHWYMFRTMWPAQPAAGPIQLEEAVA